MSTTMRPPEPPFFPFRPVRTRTLRALTDNSSPAAKIISITAPTGYGKTVLLTELYRHYRQAGVACHWMALDDRDVNSGRVLLHLESALMLPHAEVDPLQALHQGDAPQAERVASLLQSVSALREPTVLFIDNLGFCSDALLQRLLDALIFQTPAALSLVLSSTEAQPFDIARAKLEGRLQQIGVAELGLGAGEVRELLTPEVCLRLSDPAVDTIQAQTEGWPAAVRLMQIILSASPQPEQALQNFSGADEDLAALLNRQVLQDCDADFRRFLLEISLLRTFGVNLCRQVTGNARSAEYVRLLQQRNLFVLPLDRNRSWYRLHGLFREFLLDEAQREIPQPRRCEILSRAAEWCEHGGHWQDAIDYALAADALPLAVAILERVAAMFVRDRGDLHQYIEWVERLHAAGDRGGWETAFWYVWALVFQRRYEYARQQLNLLSSRLKRDEGESMSAADSTAYQRRLDVIRLAIDVYTDQLPDANRNAEEWLPGRAGDDPFNVATVACAAAICRSGVFEFVDAHRTIRLAQSSIAQAHSSDYGVSWVALIGALVRLHEGDYPLVHRELLSALQRARIAMGESAAITGTIALLAAKSAAEMSLDIEASELLALGLRRAPVHGIVDTAAFGLDAAVKLWSGVDDEKISVARLREIAAAYPPRLSVMLSCWLIRRDLRLGQRDRAIAEAGQLGLASRIRNLSQLDADESPLMSELKTAVAIDLQIAAGRFKPAHALIDAAVQQARHHQRHTRLVELAIDEANIALRSHNPAPAARHLTRAISLAAKRRYLRPFRDHAELIAGIVNETRPKDWGFAIEEERQFFAEVCRYLPIARGNVADSADESEPAPALAETPTSRELELLKLIEMGLSNQQLADRLSVSLATVKWHLYNLYGKLGVSSRAAALVRARALNLLYK